MTPVAVCCRLKVVLSLAATRGSLKGRSARQIFFEMLDSIRAPC